MSFLPVLVFISAFIFDQATKYTARMDGEVLVNQGISLGIFDMLPSWLVIVCLGGMIAYIFLTKKKYWLQHPLLAAILFGGACSNLLDRVVFGGVIDWLPIPFTSLRNNLADWCIFIAITLMCWQYVQKERDVR